MGLPAPDMTENGQTSEPANTTPANAAVDLKTPETPESAVTPAAPPAGDTQSPPPTGTIAANELPPTDTTEAEMPRYKCHKEVWALKIAAIEFDRDIAQRENRETSGCAKITPTESGYAPFFVDADYVLKHKPQAGGYYIVYSDGYRSFSPAKAFEDGYTIIH